MNVLGDLARWLAGGPDGYMDLVHCMNGDTFWITLTVILDGAVALGYVRIALHWAENERSLPSSQAKLALGHMKQIFLFCGTCGYLFIPIKMFWPAWRLYDAFMMALVFVTWRYALNTRQLRVVYHELGRSKRLAFELEESKAESRRKTFFLNAISHDLRTPLNGLMLQVELAEMSVDDPDSIRESLLEIKACARTTADLLTGFLELGRLDWSTDSVHESRFAAAELLGHVANTARPLAESKGLEIRVESPPGLHLMTDRTKLERIVQNLVGNAVKFTERGRVDVVVATSGRDVTISVADTGVGIPQSQFGSIFEEFYQVGNRERDSTKGFGLGLCIARRMAQLLQGDLTVESEVGRGSRFALTLPGAVSPAGPTGGDHPPPSPRGIPTPASGFKDRTKGVDGQADGWSDGRMVDGLIGEGRRAADNGRMVDS